MLAASSTVNLVFGLAVEASLAHAWWTYGRKRKKIHERLVKAAERMRMQARDTECK